MMTSPLPSEPLTSDQFDALMALFAPFTHPLALAVSGGSDSMALAFCVARWAKDNHHPAPIALIVDHRLRHESEAEAQTVRDSLEKLGIFAEILIWDHPPVTSRIHVIARQARYRLLREACARHGATTLLLAHHKNDQAETILERFAKGSGTDGLAGMAADSIQDDLRLLRPFLSLEKSTLIATCAAYAIPVVQDPSNESEKYARGRLRRITELLEKEGFSTDRLIDLADRAREDRYALHYYAQCFLESNATLGIDGVIRLNRAAFSALPLAIAARALASALHAIHAVQHPHPRRHLMPLCIALMTDKVFTAHSFSGCLISRGDHAISLTREEAGIQDIRPIAAGETIVWDGRWTISLALTCPLTGLVVKKLGIQSHETLDALSPALRRQVPQGRARATLPALWQGNKLYGIPELDIHHPQEKLPPAIAFLKSFPIS